MPIVNTLTLQGANGRKIVADIQVDLGRDVLVAIVREVPIEVEAPDVAGLRAALEARATDLFATPLALTPRRKRGRPRKEATAAVETDSIGAAWDRMLSHFGGNAGDDVSVALRSSLSIGALPQSEAARSLWRTLLPDAQDLLSPPTGWRAGRRTANENSLDVEVENLVKSGRIKAGGGCPYWRARAAVIHAADVADQASNRYQVARVDGATKRTALRKLATEAARIRKAFEEFNAEFKKSWPTLWDSWRDATREGHRENRAGERALIVPGLRDRLSTIVPDLIAVEEIAREVGEAVGNSEADFGKRAFVGRMLVTYHNLTGNLAGDGPIHFVDAAAEVAGLRTSDGESWRATTKKILAEANFIALRTPSDRD